MTTSEILITLIFSFWLIFTLLYALFNKRLAAFTYRRDIFRWLSAYQLFSETSRGYKLFYRDRLPDNSTTAWKDLPLTPSWKLFHIVWFPQKQVPQTVYSIIDDLVEWLEKKQGSPVIEKVNERFMYQAILRYINCFPATGGIAVRQFKIEETSNAACKEVFISDFHQQ